MAKTRLPCATIANSRIGNVRSQSTVSILCTSATCMNFQPDPARAFRGNIADLVPEFQLGDNNTVAELQHYVVGASPSGLTVDSATGELDERRSFRSLDYFPLLLEQRVRNNPQALLPPDPIDFIAVRLPVDARSAKPSEARQAYWLFGGNDSQTPDPHGRAWSDLPETDFPSESRWNRKYHLDG